MSTRAIRGPLQFDTEIIFTAAGNHTVVNESVLVVKKGANAGATQVTLPKPKVQSGRTVIIKDGQGDAATNNITIVPDGVVATTIDSAASKLIVVNYGSVALNWNGTEWGAVIDNSGTEPAGSESFTTLTVTTLDGNGTASIGLTVKASAAGAGPIALGGASDSITLGSGSVPLGSASPLGDGSVGFTLGTDSATTRVQSTSTFTGGVGSTAYTVGDMLACLKKEGVLKP